MKQHPILFSGSMVRAILDGNKTQTRRVLKPNENGHFKNYVRGKLASYSARPLRNSLDYPTGVSVGDKLWVRENHYITDDGYHETVVYAADEDAVTEHIGTIAASKHQFGLSDAWAKPHLRLRPSIFMPRWASRITLKVTDVRVERLQDISEEDAISEGVHEWHDTETGEHTFHFEGCISGAPLPSFSFQELWDSINSKRAPWESNPWVVAYTFEATQ